MAEFPPSLRFFLGIVIPCCFADLFVIMLVMEEGDREIYYNNPKQQKKKRALWSLLLFGTWKSNIISLAVIFVLFVLCSTIWKDEIRDALGFLILVFISWILSGFGF
ncbi:MAG: hypothetical protein MK172_12055 [Verrucomicrobiales bacterium]|nr:hypothetical protein [Verrucomicrobiales bacterium]